MAMKAAFQNVFLTVQKVKIRYYILLPGVSDELES